MSIHCFFHSLDLDGHCSGAIVKYFADQERPGTPLHMHPINYGHPVPWDIFEIGDSVFIVDFSFPVEDMLKLNDCVNLVWIDHHKTALEDADNNRLLCKGLRRIGVGACQLTWEYLFPERSIPTGVKMLADYDVWNHINKNVLPFQYGMRTVPETDPGLASSIWLSIFTENPLCITELIEKGRLILDYEEQQNKVRCKTLKFDTIFNDLKLCAANFGPASSKFFDSVLDKDAYDAFCLYHWSPSTQKWRISLYSSKEDIDVSITAKKYGGGGHKGAAGFECEIVPFLKV